MISEHTLKPKEVHTFYEVEKELNFQNRKHLQK